MELNNIKYLLKLQSRSIRIKYNLNFVPDLAVAITYGCNANCTYCFAKGLSVKFPDEMELRAFIKLIVWLKKQNLNKIMLFGGEPTTHSKITEIIRICRNNEMKYAIVTNGKFEHSLLDFISREDVAFFLVNINTQTTSLLEDKLIHNLDRIERKGIAISLKLNLTKRDENYHKYLDMAKRFRATISLGITYPGFSNIQSIGMNKPRVLRNAILNFVRQAVNQKVVTFIAGPIPKCLFNNPEWKYLKKYAFASSTCHDNNQGKFYSGCRIVNPDLSVFGCFNVFSYAPSLLKFKDLKALNQYFRKHFEYLKWNVPLFERCKTCKDYEERRCQGACLSSRNKGTGSFIDVSKFYY